MTFISLKHPVAGRQPRFIQVRTSKNEITARASTDGRPADWAVFSPLLKTADDEEQGALLAQAFRQCRRGWLFDECLDSPLLANSDAMESPDHFGLKAANRFDLIRLCHALEACPGLMAERWNHFGANFTTFRHQGRPLLTIDRNSLDAYGLRGSDNGPIARLLAYLAALPGVDVAVWSDLHEAMHDVAPDGQIGKLTDSTVPAEWHSAICVLLGGPAISPNTPHTQAGYQPLCGVNGARVTPVIF